MLGGDEAAREPKVGGGTGLPTGTTGRHCPHWHQGGWHPLGLCSGLSRWHEMRSEGAVGSSPYLAAHEEQGH